MKFRLGDVPDMEELSEPIFYGIQPGKATKTVGFDAFWKNINNFVENTRAYSNQPQISMIRKTLLYLFALAAAFAASSQVTPRSAFSTMPNALFPYIDQTSRLDLMDYYDSGIEKKVPNQLGDSARIVLIDDTMLAIEYAPGCEMTLVPLHRKNDELIMILQTLDIPDCDTSIKFYSHDWKPVDSGKLIDLPQTADWFAVKDKAQKSLIAGNVPFMTVCAVYDADSSTLRLTPTLGDYVTPEHLEEVKALLSSSIEYLWNGKKFAKQRTK